MTGLTLERCFENHKTGGQGRPRCPLLRRASRPAAVCASQSDALCQGAADGKPSLPRACASAASSFTAATDSATAALRTPMSSSFVIRARRYEIRVAHDWCGRACGRTLKLRWRITDGRVFYQPPQAVAGHERCAEEDIPRMPSDDSTTRPGRWRARETGRETARQGGTARVMGARSRPVPRIRLERSSPAV